MSLSSKFLDASIKAAGPFLSSMLISGGQVEGDGEDDNFCRSKVGILVCRALHTRPSTPCPCPIGNSLVI